MGGVEHYLQVGVAIYICQGWGRQGAVPVCVSIIGGQVYFKQGAAQIVEEVEFAGAAGFRLAPRR